MVLLLVELKNHQLMSRHLIGLLLMEQLLLLKLKSHQLISHQFIELLLIQL
jgi:hypothetical protein